MRNADRFLFFHFPTSGRSQLKGRLVLLFHTRQDSYLLSFFLSLPQFHVRVSRRMETFVKDSMRNRRPTDGLTERIDVLGVGVAGGGRRGRRRRRRSGTGGRGGDDDHGQPPVALIGSGHRRHRRRPSGDVDVRPRQEDGLTDQQHDEGDADAPAPVIGQPEARPAPVTQRRHLLDRRSSLVSFFFLADPRKTLEHTHNSARKRCVSLFRSLSLSLSVWLKSTPPGDRPRTPTGRFDCPNGTGRPAPGRFTFSPSPAAAAAAADREEIEVSFHPLLFFYFFVYL